MRLSRFIKGNFFLVVFLAVTSQALSWDETFQYELDGYSRSVEPVGRLECPEVPLIKYEGARIPYSRPVRVHPEFAERLERFEQVVSDAAVAIYGREPKRIIQKGSYHCRRVRSIPTLLSEHALGNAIDVYGFEFGPIEDDETLPEGLPKQFEKKFTVTLLKHWDANNDVAAYHSRFLRLLADNLVLRKDIFRVLLGPAYPGHKNHFHFDCANYILISI